MNYLINRSIIKIAAQFAPGINDPEDYGNISDELSPGDFANWVIQEHDAQRAGKHYDVRFGKNKLFSFATRKEMPEPGQQIALYPQPLHEGAYADFEGTITSGYGAGKVKKKDRGEILITRVSPRNIRFVLAHKKEPEVFNLVKLKDKKTNHPYWLMRNITPTEPIKYKKTHFIKIPAEEIDKLMTPEHVLSAKIDGAAGFARLMKDNVDILSYRTNKAGKPIVHTHRMGLGGKIEIPKHLQGKTYRGEIYGEHANRAISAQELGGLLNATVANSLKKQRDKDIKMRMALFGVAGDENDFIEQPISERRKAIDEALKYLPKDVFTKPPYAETKEEKRKLWDMIRKKKSLLTREGVVGYPVGGGKPVKVKLFKDYDVYIREMFPAMEGKYKDNAVGGFKYSIDRDGPIVGKVGTGFSDELRRDMYKNPGKYIGRVAVVRAQGQFPSGALRVPSLHAIHEDY